MMLEAKGGTSSRRKSSRSNSTSSSSVVTVQRAASLSRSAQRTPNPQDRADSPEKGTGLLPATTFIYQERPRSSSHGRSLSNTGFKEGVGNLNRWSQSTTSSRASGQPNNPKTEQSSSRRRSFATRMSIGGSSALNDLKSATGNSSPPSRKLLTKHRRSPSKGDLVDKHGPDPLPPLTFQPNPVDSARGISVLQLAPPSLVTPTPSVESADYFSEPQSGTSLASSRTTTRGPATPGGSEISRNVQPPKESSHSRSGPSLSSLTSERTVQDSQEPGRRGHSRTREGQKGSAGTDGGSSTSSIRSDKERGRKHRSPSQKTMLSKALQKANTAVLLDNAQNFEGAMDAYEDACRLLEQVMLRSTGQEDRMKLQSIVSLRQNQPLARDQETDVCTSAPPTSIESRNCKRSMFLIMLQVVKHSRIGRSVMPPRAVVVGTRQITLTTMMMVSSLGQLQRRGLSIIPMSLTSSSRTTRFTPNLLNHSLSYLPLF